MQNEEKGAFIGPECGSTDAGLLLMVSTTPNPQDPWNYVLQIITCAKCDFIIPAHLGERWDKMSIEETRQEWQNEYREMAWRSSDPEEKDDD